MFKKILFFAILFSTAISCTKQQRKSLDKQPNALGNPNSVLVLMEKNLWEGAIGDSVRYYFQGPFILMPKPEPVFNLSYSEIEHFREYKRHVRNIVVIGDLSDENAPTTKMITTALGEENTRKAKEDANFGYASIKDKYAIGQGIAYLFGNDHEELAKNIRTKFSAIRKIFNKSDYPYIKANAYAGTSANPSLSNKLEEATGVTLAIPGAYRMARQDSNEVWFRYDTEKLGMNILVTSMDYSDENQITEENLLKIRNRLGKKHITSQAKGAYMTTEREHLKVYFKKKNLNNYYALEARGVWKMVGDFMGGPFLSYMAYNPDNQKVIFIDGFVQAPSEEGQKEYIQRLETIFDSVKF